jgi:Replication protein
MEVEGILMFAPDGIPSRSSRRLYRSSGGASGIERAQVGSGRSSDVVGRAVVEAVPGSGSGKRWGGRKPLGSNANLRTPLQKGGKTLADSGGDGVKVEDSRRRRFRLQSRARSLLRSSRRVDKNGKDQPYRINNCLRAPGYQSSGATAAKMQVSSSDAGLDAVAVYRSLQVCGSVWHCPICAARVANERSSEIRDAMLLAAEKGFKAVLVTLTARHNRKTVLKDQLKAMTQAYAAVWRGESAKRFRDQFGILGMIRTLECTHGKEHGWHPHIHILIFVPNDCDVVAFGSAFRMRWECMAAKYDLVMNKHGFDIQDNTQKVADYIAKWGHDPSWGDWDELARWHTKIGRGREENEHYTPWQLLDFADNGDEAAGVLWREYALTFYRKKQLHWSRGLRKKLGMEKELTDEEVAQKEQENATTEYEIKLNNDQWNWIKGNDLRVELLELVERCTAHDIIDRCKQEFGFEPELILPGDLVKDMVLTDEDREMFRVAEMVRILELGKKRRVLTPDGVGIVSFVTKCPILKRWRCSVLLESGGAGCWRAYDVAAVSLV